MQLYRCRKVSAGIVGAVYRTRWQVFTNGQVQKVRPHPEQPVDRE